MPADYSSAIEWLYGTQLFGIKLGLESMRRLVEGLKIPQNQKIIHVAGTNGKGSTCAMMAGIAEKAGLKVGLYTSPHLVSFCERIQINGQMITESDVVDGIEQIRLLAGKWEPHPTFFEITTALALSYFARQNTDLIVLETGMGGRMDATNVVIPSVSVITPIALDHQQWLGQTIAEIAREKAGIMKPGIPTISAPQQPEAAAVLRSHGPVTFVNLMYPASGLALQGEHQQSNAALAVAALEAAGFRFSAATIRKALEQVNWPARFQRITSEFIIDGAHNPAGALVLAQTWKQQFGERKAHLIFGAVSAKDIRGVLEVLLPLAAIVHMVTLKSPRAHPAAELAALALELDPTLPVLVANSLEEALADRNSPTLLTGSLYLCGEVLARMPAGRPFEASAQ